MNSKNKPKAGKGWRLLSRREKYMGCKLNRLATTDIQCWSPRIRRWLDGGRFPGFAGVCPCFDYRTQKPRGYFLTH